MSRVKRFGVARGGGLLQTAQRSACRDGVTSGRVRGEKCVGFSHFVIAIVRFGDRLLVKRKTYNRAFSLVEDPFKRVRGGRAPSSGSTTCNQHSGSQERRPRGVCPLVTPKASLRRPPPRRAAPVGRGIGPQTTVTSQLRHVRNSVFETRRGKRGGGLDWRRA